MPNITSFPLLLTILGDGASLTATVTLAFPATSVSLVSVFASSGASVSSNIASVVPSGSNIVFTFNATFTGQISVSLAVTGATFSNLPLQPVLHIGALPTGANTVGKVNLLGNTGAVLDAATGAAIPANALQVGASDGTLLQPLSNNVKGTQGARGLSIQALNDAGRTALTFFVDDLVGSASEVLATMSITKGAVAQTAATSYTVTAGKTLRLTSISYTVRSSTNAQQISKMRIRTAASGILATSPIILTFIGEAPAALTYSQWSGLPDGYEIAGGTQIAMSHIETVTPASTELTVCLVGYEY